MSDPRIRTARIVPALPDTVGWGVALAVVAACISGLAVWLNGFAVKQMPDAAVYTTLKNGVAAVILIGLAAMTVRPAEVRSMGRASWVRLLVIGVVGGSVPFLLFFVGLAEASTSAMQGGTT